MPSLRQTTLVQLRRYQRLVTYGAGAAITLLLLLAFGLVAMSMVRSVLLNQQQDFVVDRSLVMSEIDAREASLRHAVVSAQLAWHDGSVADLRTVERFRASGGTMTLRPSRSLTPQLAFVSGHPGATDAELQRYLGLAVQMAHSTTTSSLLRGKIQTGYYYSARRDFAALIPAPAPVDARAQAMLADREALMRVLDTGLEQAPAMTRTLRPDYPRVAWLPPALNPLTGTRAVRAAAVVRDGDAPVAVLVAEYDPQGLLHPLTVDRFGGTFLIVGDDRSVVASYAQHPANPGLVERVRQSREAMLPDHRLRAIYRNGIVGIFTISDRLGDTGWNLVYAFSWTDILRAISVELMAAGIATIALIAALWSLLLLFTRRKFAPVYAQSQRVFDSEQLSRTLIETAPVGLGVIARADGQLLLASPLMERLAERAKPSGGTLPSALVRLHRTRGGEAVAHAELPLDTMDGARVDLAVSTAPARYQGQAVLVAAFVDVTAQKQIEHQLRHAKRAADDANAAKSVFVATMSHEIRTPLNAFLGNLELLSHTPLNAKQQDRLATIRSASDNLLSIISDVLDFSKIEAGEMAFEQLTFPVFDVLDRALAVFAPAARAKGLTLRVRAHCAVDQTMRGDPVRLGQILNNLLGNAIKFTERGAVMVDVAVAAGRIALAVRDTGIGMSPAQQAGLFQPFAQADRTISRRFGGTGLGLVLCRRLTEAMGGTIGVDSRLGDGSRFTVRLPLGEPVRAAGRVFGAVRGPVVVVSKDPDGRAGIGRHLRAWGLDARLFAAPAEADAETLRAACAVVLAGSGNAPDWDADDENRLVERGTRVVVASADGPWQPVRAGRLVEVTGDSVRALQHALRIALLGEPEPRRRGRGAAATALGRRLTVLVAEDNPVNRLLLAEQLALLGCDAEVVASGEDALVALASRRRDVLLTDLNMPGIDGCTLALRARARHPALPVVAVTAQATLDDRARCAAAGIARVVAKPLSLDGLRAVLQAVTGDAVMPGPGDAGRDAREPSDLLAGRPLPASLVELFRETSETSLATIRDAMRAGETARALAELHSLKGTLGVFRAAALAQRCAALETAWAQPGGFDTAQFDALADAVRALAPLEAVEPD
ncbi:response regulator [Burkholderia stabilis]|uniref:Virulence sensor protein BvgS n=1 Tax=Burkholderia stabilis TaxID=95485 RepID=A0A4V1PRT6_9BURK|nr:ATP-binding protein [Burkholderia stabilis]RXV68724.1 response regulator [Burkholderia stabilis]